MTDSPNPGRPAPAPDDSYIPQVGDRVRLPDWADSIAPVTVTAVGATRFLAVDPDEGEESWDIDRNWVKVVQPPPIPDNWRIVTATGHMFAPSADVDTARRHAQRLAFNPPAVALLHTWTDDDGTYRSTIEPLDR